MSLRRFLNQKYPARKNTHKLTDRQFRCDTLTTNVPISHSFCFQLTSHCRPGYIVPRCQGAFSDHHSCWISTCPIVLRTWYISTSCQRGCSHLLYTPHNKITKNFHPRSHQLCSNNKAILTGLIHERCRRSHSITSRTAGR
jgi:hypothetical protein